MITSVTSLTIAIALAVFSYVATYASGISLKRRKDHLDRINAQLQHLYGPLLANLSAGDMLYDQ